MDTVVQPPPDAELHLLTDWGDPTGRARRGRSAILSVFAHIAAILFLIFMPGSLMQPQYREKREPVVTPLIDPPLILTQKAPNPSKTIREMRSPDLSPRLPLPPGPSAEPQTPAPKKHAAMPPPPPPPPPKTTAPPLPEPPKLEIAANEPPKLTIPVQPPQAQQPKSKPSFEEVPTGITPVPPSQRTIEIPGPSVQNAIRGSLQGLGKTNPGTAQIPSAGADLPTLLTDPMGVDFTPYLAHVLAAVKQYWNSIIPSLPSVRAGHSGTVSVQFAIQRDGTVRTAVFAQSTGEHALDDAAIQAISGGGPFGPLPVLYKGGEIHVQMNFMYNAPRH